MKNVIVISGLAGSGKTYIAEEVKQELKDMFEVQRIGCVKDDYMRNIIEYAEEDKLLILEMHPPFPDFTTLQAMEDINFIHVVISKDWTDYQEEISLVKGNYLDKFWHNNPDRERWDTDIIKYNKERFKHISMIKGDFKVWRSTEGAIEEIVDFSKNIRRKEVLTYAYEHYNYMLYHSPYFNGVGYEGTAPTDDKFLALRLDKLLDLDKRYCPCLDIGCNIGAISFLLNQEHFNHVDAIDIEPENIKCAEWLQRKLHKNSSICFDCSDFMKLGRLNSYPYVFALAVLHHVAKKYPFVDVVKKLSDLTEIAAVIEINEMPDMRLDIKKIKDILLRYFKKIEVIGNSQLPVSKKVDSKRWIIHCIK